MAQIPSPTWLSWGWVHLPWAAPVRASVRLYRRFLVDSHGCLLLHGVGDMAVDVERGLCADVAYHGGERLDIHSVFECHRSKGVAQVVEADLLAPRSLQYLLEFAVDRVGISRLTLLDGRREHPLAGGGFLMLRKDFQHIRGQKDGADGGFGLGLGDLGLRPPS